MQPLHLEVGREVALAEDVDRYPHFIAPRGAVGTVVESTAELVCVRLREPLAGAEEWDNEVIWSNVDDARVTAAAALTTTMPLDARNPDDVVVAIRRADEAFWATMAEELPAIRTGDVDPLARAAWVNAMRSAVAGWVAGNVGAEDPDALQAAILAREV